MIDCDVHNDWATAEVLLPYLEPYYRDCLARGELPGPRGAFPHGHRAWFHPEGYRRADVNPEDGSAAGADYPLMKRLLLDRYEIDYAILTGEEIEDVSTIGNVYYASALARAYNDWMIEHWLAADPRLKGSMIVAPQDPAGAAKEIRRIGSHPGVVQVLVTTGSQKPYGDPFYHPIWDAAHEVGLPLAIHLGGHGGINGGPGSVGPPTFYWEAHAIHCEPSISHVASIIAHGVFEKWPGMMAVIVECGVSWLPGILWRLDNDYKALRKETPWLKRLPSEYARDHIRLTTQPMERPDNIKHLWGVLEAIGGQDVLLYSSDYPHWDFDDPTQLPIPKEWRENVFELNARKVYRKLPERRPTADR